MEVRATKISFIEGHRRKPGKVYDLNDPKHFDIACMVDAREPVEETAKPGPATRQRKAASFLDVFGEKAKVSKESKPAEPKASKSTGDQDVI